jgi:hypothetical protein
MPFLGNESSRPAARSPLVAQARTVQTSSGKPSKRKVSMLLEGGLVISASTSLVMVGFLSLERSRYRIERVERGKWATMKTSSRAGTCSTFRPMF